MNISSSSLSLQLATFRSQALGALINSNSPGNDKDLWAAASGQFSASSGTTDALSMLTSAGEAKSLPVAGRNLALFDPESAYRMMSVINSNDVSYKAQFAEMSEMKSYLVQMQAAGQSLGSIDASTSNQGVAARLQDFVGQYNGWVERFNPDMQDSGLLAGTQAAQVSRYELDQSIKNVFNGASDGVHGLADLGIVIDPASGLASLDSGKLDALLASNRSGAVNALHQFSANFSKSASLLNSDGNFIPNRLNNLSKVIDYFAENKAALQSEFGSGDVARPRGQVAQALAAYNQRFGG